MWWREGNRKAAGLPLHWALYPFWDTLVIEKGTMVFFSCCTGMENKNQFRGKLVGPWDRSWVIRHFRKMQTNSFSHHRTDIWESSSLLCEDMGYVWSHFLQCLVWWGWEMSQQRTWVRFPAPVWGSFRGSSDLLASTGSCTHVTDTHCVHTNQNNRNTI